MAGPPGDHVAEDVDTHTHTFKRASTLTHTHTHTHTHTQGDLVGEDVDAAVGEDLEALPAQSVMTAH